MPTYDELSPLERLGYGIERFLRGTDIGVGEQLSGMDRRAANVAMILQALSGPGGGMYGELESHLRGRSREIGSEAERRNVAMGPSVPRDVGRVFGRTAAGLPETIAFTRGLGAIPGLTAQGTLDAADQGLVPALEHGARAGMTGAAMKYLEPFNPIVRAGGTGAVTYLLDPSEEGVEKTANTAINALTAMLPTASRSSGRIQIAPTRDAAVRIEGKREALPARYELVPHESLKPSHDSATFSPRKDYGAIQERDYHASKNEQSKVIQMADDLDTRELLSRVPNANSGPAVVDPAGNVWGGNGRTMAQDRVWRGQAKTTPAELKAAVVKAAPEFGLDAKAAAALEHPAIVRVLDPAVVPTDRDSGLTLSRELNVETTHAATPTARAQSQAAALDQGLTVFSDAAHTLGDDVSTVRDVFKSGPVAKRFAEALQADGVIPPSERARWLTPEGTLTKHGLDQAEQMLLARVLPDQTLVESLPASLREKVLRNVPAILGIERAAPGTLVPLIEGAARSEIARAAVPAGAKPLSVDEFNAQVPLDPSQGAPSQGDPRVAAVQRLIADKSAKEMRSAFRSMNERVSAAASGQMDLLTGKVASPLEAVDEVLGVSLAPRPAAPAPSAAATELPLASATPAAPERLPPRSGAATPDIPTEPPGVTRLRELARKGKLSNAESDELLGLMKKHPAEWKQIRVGEKGPPEPPEIPPPAAPPATPPRPPRPPAAAAPEPVEPRFAGPPEGPADYYRRVSEKQAFRLDQAKRAARTAREIAEAPFKTTEGTVLPRPLERRAEEVRALLDETLKAEPNRDMGEIVGDVLTRKDLSLGDHADVILPTIARFYQDHAYIAKRGIVPDQELKALAENLGMTESVMLRRMVGEVPNAETIHAMGNIVQTHFEKLRGLADELSTASARTPKKMAEFAESHKLLGLLWAQFRGARGEMGRAMRAIRVANQAVRSKGFDESQLDDLFNTTYRGEHELNQVLRRIQKLEAFPQAQRKFMLDSSRPVTEKMMTLWRASLMSGGATFARNVLGNLALVPTYHTARAIGHTTGKALDWLPVERIRIPLGGGRELLNIGVRGRTSEPTTHAEAYQEVVGMLGAGRTAARMWRDTMFGEPPEGGHTLRSLARGAVAVRPPIEDPSVPRRRTFKNETLEAVVSTPFRLNEAFDVGFRYPQVVGRLTSLAYREANKQGFTDAVAAKEFMDDFISTPPKWAWDEAYKHGQRQTLTESPGPKGQAMLRLLDAIPPLKVFSPFQRIAGAITRETGRYSPAGLFMRDVKEQLAAGGAARDEALGKIMLGSSISALAVYLARQGVITGSGPSDPAERKLWLQQGNRPYSLQYRDKQGTLNSYGYRGIEPGSSLLGIAADFGEKYEELSDSQKKVTAGMIVSSMARNVADIPVMTGISDVLEASGDPVSIDRYIAKLGATMAVPRIAEAATGTVRAVARLAIDEGDHPQLRPDPYLREARGILDAVMQRAGLGNLPTPGEEFAAVPRTDFWAQPIRKDEMLGPDYLSPFRKAETKHDRVTAEIAGLVKRGAMSAPGELSRKLGAHELTDREYLELKRAARGGAKRMLDVLVASRAWAQISAIPNERVRDFVKAEIMKTALEGTAELARRRMSGNLVGVDALRSTLNERLVRLLNLEGVK